MKAIRVKQFGGPEFLQLEEVPDFKPGPGQVLVKLRAAGVNPVETYMRTGNHAHAPALPWTPGADGAGEVSAIGDGVTGWKSGDRVYTSATLTGSYAEYTLCAPDRIHCLPDSLSFAQGAAIGVPYATAWRALFQRAKAKAGDWLLVHGASGGVGTAALQIARAAGLRVTGTGGTEAGRQQILEQGGHVALDHGAPDYLKQALAHTGGRGFDVILELLANVNLGKDLPLLAPGGKVAVVGSRGPVEINARDLMTRDASIVAMSLFNANDAERREIHSALGAGFESGTLRPLIGLELPLAQAAEAHRKIMEPGARGKIVLVT
jgi:NADPH2:quinone reductase